MLQTVHQIVHHIGGLVQFRKFFADAFVVLLDYRVHMFVIVEGQPNDRSRECVVAQELHDWIGDVDNQHVKHERVHHEDVIHVPVVFVGRFEVRLEFFFEFVHLVKVFHVSLKDVLALGDTVVFFLHFIFFVRHGV